MKVRVTNDARDDLRSIKSFIVLRDAAAAAHVIANIARVLARLRLLPRLGHRGAVHGTYQVNVPHLPFVIVYRIDIGRSDELVVLRVYHHAPDRLED
jgi:toxin ParE1/3/4